MAQIFKRPDPSGMELMVGLNARTEPMAIIAGAFELLDDCLRESKPSGSLISVYPVFACMSQGYDMSKVVVENFLNYYNEIIGHPLMTVYSNRRKPLIIGQGGRFMPTKSGKWASKDWLQFNEARKQMWQGWIREEMATRGWTLDDLLNKFSVDITHMPMKSAKTSFEDTVVGLLRQVLINQARLEDQFQRLLIGRRAA